MLFRLLDFAQSALLFLALGEHDGVYNAYRRCCSSNVGANKLRFRTGYISDSS